MIARSTRPWLSRLGEEEVKGQIELVGNRVERADGGLRLARFDLRQQAGRDPYALSQLTQPDMLPVPFGAQTPADHTGPIRRRRARRTLKGDAVVLHSSLIVYSECN